MHGLDRIRLDKLERGLEEELLEERVPDLNGRALLLRPRSELERREQGRARDTVAAGVAPDEVHRAPRARAARLAHILGARETHTHGVHERVLGVARLERDVPGDVGDADAVPIEGDAAGHARDRTAHRGSAGISEEERVQNAGRARAHREDVAQDSADACGRALERLDRGGVVVALDLEDAEESSAYVDRASVLARTHGHGRAS